MALTTTRELRWDAPGAAVLNGVAGSARTLVRDFLEEAGWTVVWQDAGAQKVVLRNSLMHGGSGCYVRILDDGSFTGGARVARVDVYESMTDIDTGTGHAGGGWIGKSMATTGAARAWTLHADERTFYGTTHMENDTGIVSIGVGVCAFGVGDYAPLIPGDPGVFAALASPENPQTNNAMRCGLVVGSKSPGAAFYGNSPVTLSVSRSPDLAAAVTTAAVVNMAKGTSGNDGFGSNLSSIIQTHPSPGTAGWHAMPALIQTQTMVRGRLRGLFVPITTLQGVPGFDIGTVHSPLGTTAALSLATLCGAPTEGSYSPNNFGKVFVERSLPWDDV